MSEELTDEEAQEAKNKIATAIQEYYKTVEPDVYIDDWAVVVHKDSIALSQMDKSMVSTLVPTGQAFHRTAGLLQLAAKASVDF